MAGFPARCLCKVNLYNLIFLTLTVLFYKFHNYKMNKSWQSETLKSGYFVMRDVMWFFLQDDDFWKITSSQYARQKNMEIVT